MSFSTFTTHHDWHGSRDSLNVWCCHITFDVLLLPLWWQFIPQKWLGWQTSGVSIGSAAQKSSSSIETPTSLAECYEDELISLLPTPTPPSFGLFSFHCSSQLNLKFCCKYLPWSVENFKLFRADFLGQQHNRANAIVLCPFEVWFLLLKKAHQCISYSNKKSASRLANNCFIILSDLLLCFLKLKWKTPSRQRGTAEEALRRHLFYCPKRDAGSKYWGNAKVGIQNDCHCGSCLPGGPLTGLKMCSRLQLPGLLCTLAPGTVILI